MNVKRLAIMAILTALAVVGRTVLAGVPDVKPTTFIIIMAGFLLGKKEGFIVGAMVAFLSGITTGLGYWTVFQVAGWGLIGFLSGYFKKWSLLVAWSVVSAYLFGVIVNLSSLVTVPSLAGYLAFELGGLPFDTIHAVNNLLIMLFVGVPLINYVKKHKPSVLS